MKYFKFTQVYSETQQSVLVSSAPETYDNRVFPSCIKNLTVIWNSSPYYFGVGDDSSKSDPANLITELSLSDFIAELTTNVDSHKHNAKNQTTGAYNDRHEQLLSKYEYSNPISLTYKYSEANEFLQNGTLTGWLAAESQAAGISTEAIAQDYVDDYNTFRVEESKLAGLRTKCNKRIELMTVEPDGSNLIGISTYQSATEDIGDFDFGSEITDEVRSTYPSFINKETDKIFDYYFTPDLGMRWDYRAMITL